MPFSPEALYVARKEGYSDNELYAHLAQTDPRFAEAQKADYKLDEVAQHFSKPREANGPLDRAASSAAASLPGVQSVQALTNPAAQGPDKAAAVAGDVGNLAGLVAEIAAAPDTGGLSVLVPVAAHLGAGAALGAAQGALAPVSAAMGQAGRALGESPLNPLNLIADRIPENSGSVPLQFLKRVPGTLGEIGGEMLPASAVIALGGKVANALGAKPPTPAGALPPDVQELQDHGYPITPAHLKVGDTSLKAATANPVLSNTGDVPAYMKALANAQKADVGRALGSTLDPSQKTAQLADKAGEAYNNALAERQSRYKAMIDLVDKPGTDLSIPGTPPPHAGRMVAQKIMDDLKSQGVNIAAVMRKMVAGIPVTPLDVGTTKVTPQQAVVGMRFAKDAAQIAPKVTNVDDLVKTFTEDQNLFPQGGAGNKRVLQGLRGTIVDTMGDILKGRSPEAYKAWQAQRNNWHQTQGLVDAMQRVFPGEDRNGEPAPYSAKNTEPVKFFENKLLGQPDKITAFKDFLQRHGEDPGLVEEMGKDYLSGLGERAPKGREAEAVARGWRAMSPETKAALFSPKTLVDVQAALDRATRAQAPLEVMGTQARGGSQTGALNNLATAGKLGRAVAGKALPLAVGGGLGAAAGSMVGGPGAVELGAGAGAALGRGVEHVLQQRAAAAQAARELAAGQAALRPPVLAPATPGRPGIPPAVQKALIRQQVLRALQAQQQTAQTQGQQAQGARPASAIPAMILRALAARQQQSQ